MRKKKFLMYILAGLVPVAIFLLCAGLNKFLPFGDELLNSYDSFTQYPGMILEYARLIRSGNIFYSWSAGLGFNFFSSITYYGMSPLNLFGLLASPENYHMFIAIMTLVRFSLLGLSMCFYLDKKNVKPLYVVLFSTIYALMGYTSTYYYNYIWIDSIIMLPLVIHGLDKVLEGKSPAFYIFTLGITIIFNYYIGYMICIFSLVWFLYKLFTKIDVNDRKKITKTFIISSLLAGLMGAVVILPSMFALLTGKAELYGTISFFGANRNVLTFLYTFTTGAYQQQDQMYGPALVYSTIFVFILTIFYFFNKDVSKREKIATIIVIIFFYLSFSLNILNFAWQFFQKPIWWQSRFSFTFSFFLITLASEMVTKLDKTEFKTKYRIIILIGLIIGIVVGAFVKWKVQTSVPVYTYIYLGLSILLLIEEMFLLDKKGFLPMVIIFTVIELSLNTFNSLKNNYRYMSYTNYQYLKKDVPKTIEELNSENEYFYRMEILKDFTSNDGMYFGYNGINYFNSVRNISVINLFENLGVTVYDKCHVELMEFDPVLLSILNIKYLYGNGVSYFKEVKNRTFINEYPLGIGFMVNEDVKTLELDSEDGVANRNKLLKTMTGSESDFYEKIEIDKFKEKTEGFINHFTYSFTSQGHYLLMPTNFGGKIIINGKEGIIENDYKEIMPKDKVEITYTITSEFEEEEVFVHLLDLEKYKSAMEVLSKEVLLAKTNINGHILEGNIEVKEDNKYLFTSIEYERGMKVYVDGEEIKPDIVMGALIGLHLDKGEHEIIIDYIPRGLIVGSIVSIISLFGSVVYLQIRKNRL